MRIRRARRCAALVPAGGGALPARALASVPARKGHDKRAEQPVTAENPRLTRTADRARIRLARLNCLSITTSSFGFARSNRGGGRDDVPAPGMTFRLHRALRLPGLMGAAFSETAAITETGHELLTDFPRQLVIL